MTISANSDVLLVNQDVHFTLNAPGATFVRVFHNGEAMDVWDDGIGYENRDITLNFGDNFAQVYAIAYYDNVYHDFDPQHAYEEHWFTGISNLIETDVISYGNLPSPSVTIDKATPARGEVLTVTITPNEEAPSDLEIAYEVRIRDNNGDEQYYYRMRQVGMHSFDMPVPTSMLPEGMDYCVCVCTYAPGYDGWEDENSYVYFDVEGEEENSFTLSKTDVALGESIDATLNLVTDEAEEARLVFFESDDGVNYSYNGELYFYWYGGKAGSLRFYFTGGSYFRVYPEIRTNGVWHKVDGIQEMCITVTAHGSLDASIITADNSVEEGQPYTFTFTTVDNAELYSYGVFDVEYPDVNVFYRELSADDPGDTVTDTVPAYRLEPLHTYGVYVRATAEGYESSYSCMTFCVLPKDGKVVTLTCDKNESDNTAMVGEQIRFTVNAPGATFVRIYFSNGDVHDIWDYSGSGNKTVNTNFWNVGFYHAIARAYYGSTENFNPDDCEYGGVSDAIEFSVASIGRAPYATLNLDRDEVTKGDMLNVEIVPGEETLEGVEYTYYIDIFDCEGMYYTCIEIHHEGTQPFETLIPTAMLPEDVDYRLAVNVHCINYESVYGDWTYGPQFRVVGSLQGNSMTVSPLSVLTDEDIRIDLALTEDPMADGRIYVNGVNGTDGEWDEWIGWLGGGIGEKTMRFSEEPGSYQLTPQMNVGEDNWVNIPGIEPVVVVVSAPNGRLDAPVIRKDTAQPAGEYLTVTFAPPAGTRGYIEGMNFDYYMEYRETDISSDGTVTLVTDILVEEGIGYRVRVSSFKKGYAAGSAEVTFVGVSSEWQLPVALSASKTDTIPNETITFTVSAEGATHVKVYGDEWTEFINLDEFTDNYGEDVTFDWTTYGGTCNVFAVAFDEDWNPIGMSNIVTVEITPVGETLPPVVQFPDTVTRGETFIVTVTPDPASACGQYFIDIGGIDGIDFYTVLAECDKGDDHSPFTVTVPTSMLEPGSYWLAVTHFGLGYDPARVESVITVTEGEDAPSFTVSESSVTVGQSINVLMYLPGCEAEQIRVCYMDAEGANSRWYTYLKEDILYDDVGTLRIFANLSGNYEVWLELLYSDADDFVDSGLPHKFVRVSKNADLPQAAVYYPAIVTEGAAFEVSFEEIEHGSLYFVRVYDCDEDMRFVDGTDMPQNGETKRFSTTELAPGHFYRIEVYANGEIGYNASLTIGYTYAAPASEFTPPAALTTIEAEAFTGLPMRCVRIPGNTQSIGSSAFANCENLICVYIPDSVTQIASDAFSGCNAYLTIVGNRGSAAESFADANGIRFAVAN